MRLRRSSPEVRLEMTPLIDVVFLLLVFFIFSLVLMVRADVLGIELPEVGSGESATRRAAVRVTLTEAGEVLVDGEASTLAEAGGAVRALLDAADGDEPPAVVVVADARAASGLLIELADGLVAAGVRSFSVLGRPAEDAGAAGGAPDVGGGD